jgi:hypothetical protein
MQINLHNLENEPFWRDLYVYIQACLYDKH